MTFKMVVATIATLVFTGLSTAQAAEPVKVFASKTKGDHSAQNTLDGDLSTRWNAKGEGEFIQYKFAEPTAIEALNIAFFKGDKRAVSFKIESTETPWSATPNWQTHLATVSDKTTDELQTYTLSEPVTATYFRIVGYGFEGNWGWSGDLFSINDVEFIDYVEPCTVNCGDNTDDETALLFSLSAQACTSNDEYLDIQNGTQLENLSSADLSCTRTDSGDQFIYHITWHGNDFNQDSNKDTLSFDLHVEAFSGSSYVYTATEAESSMTALGSSTTINDSADIDDLDATGVSVWGVDNNDQVDGMIEGQTLRFTVDNIVVSTKNYLGKFNGFTDIETVETDGGREHSHVIGQGSGLDSNIFNTPTASFNFDALDEFVITNTGDYYSTRGWGITDIQFSMTIKSDTSNEEPIVSPDDWSSLRLYGHAYNVNGFTDAEYEWIADHNDLFCTEKRHSYITYGSPSSEYASGIVAQDVKINNPETKPLFYWNATVIYDTIYETIAETLPDNPEWVNSKEEWDWANAAFRTWWASVAKDQINNYAHEGVFIDAVAKVEQAGTEEHLHAVMDTLPGFVLYNGFWTTNAGALLVGLDTLEHADGVYIEPFMHYTVNTAAKGKKLLDNLLQVPANKTIIASYNPEPAWNSTDHKFGLASYLIIANEYSFFRYAVDGGYTTDNLLYWHKDFGEYIGAPRGVAKVDGYQYSRVFENATVNVDLENKTSSIVWGPTEDNYSE